MSETTAEIQKKMSDLLKKREDGDMLQSEFEEQNNKLLAQLQQAAMEEGRKQGQAQASRTAQVEAKATKIMGLAADLTKKIFPDNHEKPAFRKTVENQIRDAVDNLVKERNVENKPWNVAWVETVMALTEAEITQVGEKVVSTLADPEEIKEREAKAKAEAEKDEKTKGKSREQIAKEKEADVQDVNDNPRVSGEGAKGASTEEAASQDEKALSEWVRQCAEDPETLNDLAKFGEIVTLTDKLNVEEGAGSKILLRGHDGTFRAPDHATSHASA